MPRQETIITLCACLVLGVAAIASGDWPRNEKVTLDALPGPVRAAIARVVGDAHLDEISTRLHNGATAYEVEFDRDWREHTVLFDAAGNVLERAIEIELADVPDAVLLTVREVQPDGTIDEVERIAAGRRTLYEVSIDLRNGAERELLIDAAGGLIAEYEDD